MVAASTGAFASRTDLLNEIGADAFNPSLINQL